MVQAIKVNRDVSITPGNGAISPRTATSAYSFNRDNVFRNAQNQSPLNQNQNQAQSFSSSARTRPRARSASDLLNLDRPSKTAAFHDDTLLAHPDHENRQDGIAELIDFLRNHSPPPSNFMSVPEGLSDADRGAWYRLRKLGKRRSLTKPIKSPQNIRLPDSAVSGTTIGGHRHIAISIPLDASPFGRTPKSQYPVYQHRNMKPLTSRYAPTRAILNEKGIVTVLRTVAEDHELSASASPDPQQNPTTDANHGSRALTSGSPCSPDTRTSSGNKEYFNCPTTPPRVTTPNQVRQTSDAIRNCLSHGHPGMDMTPGQDGVAMRTSSKTPDYFVPPATSSIDAMMSQTMSNQDVQPCDHFCCQQCDGETSPRLSISKSIVTLSESENVISDAREVKTTPVIAEEKQIWSPHRKMENQPITVITNSPLAPSKAKFQNQQLAKDRSSTSSLVDSPQNRREKVRDRKRRDMDAQRNASMKRRSLLVSATIDMDQGTGYKEPAKEEPIQEEQLKEEETKEPQHDSGVPNSSDGPPVVPAKSPKRQSFCPIMVVADIEPSPPPKSRRPGPTRKLPELPVKKAVRKATPSEWGAATKSVPKSASQSWLQTDKRPVSPAVTSSRNASNNPTPPRSAPRSPTRRQASTSMDRASLSRRREWNAAREQERKLREARAKASAQDRAPKLVTAKDEQEGGNLPLEKEVMRRYEAYREYRFREMERRVRRLERNGDVWLRALVPVLDNLNRTLANTNEEHPCRAKDWASDEEIAPQPGLQKKPPIAFERDGSRGRRLARSSNSEREFLAQLVKTRDELEAGSISDDMSGFGTIEPLMRELAGRSRLSFEARSLGVGEEDDHLFPTS